jgi:hypothetical protein
MKGVIHACMRYVIQSKDAGCSEYQRQQDLFCGLN